MPLLKNRRSIVKFRLSNTIIKIPQKKKNVKSNGFFIDNGKVVRYTINPILIRLDQSAIR